MPSSSCARRQLRQGELAPATAGAASAPSSRSRGAGVSQTFPFAGVLVGGGGLIVPLTRCAPPPAGGGGLGGGHATGFAPVCPLPTPPPQAGGEQTECAA